MVFLEDRFDTAFDVVSGAKTPSGLMTKKDITNHKALLM